MHSVLFFKAFLDECEKLPAMKTDALDYCGIMIEWVLSKKLKFQTDLEHPEVDCQDKKRSAQLSSRGTALEPGSCPQGKCFNER